MLDCREYVNMESESFKGKSKEEIWRLLCAESKQLVIVEYFLKGLKEIFNAR